MDPNLLTIFSQVKTEAPQETANAPDYSYSTKTKQLTGTAVALNAVAILIFITLAITRDALDSLGESKIAVVVIVGLVWTLCFFGGPITGFWTYHHRINEIAAREFAFALTCKNPDLQFKYYSSAAENGNEDAINWGYMTGQNLMREALHEVDAQRQNIKFESGLRLYSSAGIYSAKKLRR